MSAVVVKIGSSSLVGADGSPRADRIEELASQIAELRLREYQVLLVSSGAVATGRAALGWGTRQLSGANRRAAAAVGQGILARVYELALASCGLNLAQVLVTRTDVAKRPAYVAFGMTLRALLDRGVIPVLNENDTLADPSLSFPDNDTLAAIVAGMIQADWLLLLTDTPGLYTADPKTNPGAVAIPVLSELTAETMALAGKSASQLGRGGMDGKLAAASLAREVGVKVAIAAADVPEGILRWVLRGEQPGTLILPVQRPLSARQHWIRRIAPVAGTLFVDEGAARAVLGRRASLLVAGITRVEGLFAGGDVVDIACAQPGDRNAGEPLARGVVGCDAVALSAQLADLRGGSRGLAEGRQGRSGAARAAVHRDDLVVLSRSGS
ncbi:MAG: glutamate 5-kinase [Bacillota bacterium]|nr:glutamate 5-kinase [Bacillota bacterium]